MDFFAVLGLGLVVTVLLIILRKERPEIAVLLAIVAAGLMLGAVINKIAAILLVFETLAVKAEFGAQICKDAGESGMAAKIELAGKIFILGLGLPVLAGLMDLIFRMF